MLARICKGWNHVHTAGGNIPIKYNCHVEKHGTQKDWETRIIVWSNSPTSGHIPVRLERWSQRDPCSQQHHSQRLWGGPAQVMRTGQTNCSLFMQRNVTWAQQGKRNSWRATMSWAELRPPPPANSYTEALTPRAQNVRDRVFKEVVKSTWGH